jgi:CRP/FNR family transcriptional activator FtrB
MDTINSDQVRSVNLFSQVSEAHFPRLLKAASLRIAPSRTVLFMEGDHPDALYTLIAGTVELFSRHHERRCTVSILQCARPFMLSSIFDDRHRISARTLASSRLVVVPTEVIRELIETDLAFARQAARELASDYHLVIADFKDSRLRTTIERLADWMLRSDLKAGGSGRFAMSYDKRTLPRSSCASTTDSSNH